MNENYLEVMRCYLETHKGDSLLLTKFFKIKYPDIIWDVEKESAWEWLIQNCKPRKNAKIVEKLLEKHQEAIDNPPAKPSETFERVFTPEAPEETVMDVEKLPVKEVVEVFEEDEIVE